MLLFPKYICQSKNVKVYGNFRRWCAQLVAFVKSKYITETLETNDKNMSKTATQELVFFNSKKPGIHLTKVDNVTMKSLPNVLVFFCKDR